LRSNFDVSVGVAPKQRQAGEPIFRFDGAADSGGIFGRQDARGGGEFGAGDFSAHGAGSDFDLRVIADTLDLAELAVGHKAEFVTVFRKPDGGVDRDSGFAEGRERDVVLSVDLGGDGHRGILNNV